LLVTEKDYIAFWVTGILSVRYVVTCCTVSKMWCLWSFFRSSLQSWWMRRWLSSAFRWRFCFTRTAVDASCCGVVV